MQQHLFYDFGAPVQVRLRLKEVEEILRRTRVLVPVPSRPTLIGLCEEGILDGEKSASFGWIVTEESFKAWVRGLQRHDAAA